MSSHSCSMSAVLSPQDGVGMEAIKAAFAPFFSAYGLSFDELVEEGEITLDYGAFTFNIEFAAAGNGFKDPHIDALVAALGKLFQAPDFIEFFDNDIGDPSLRCVPRFIGDEGEQKVGRLQYGLIELVDRIRSIVPREKLQEMEQFILSSSGLVNKAIPSVI